MKQQRIEWEWADGSGGSCDYDADLAASLAAQMAIEGATVWLDGELVAPRLASRDATPRL